MSLRSYVKKGRPALWTTMKHGSKPRRLAAQHPKAKPPRKRVNQVSDKQRARNRAYNARVKVWKLENPQCRACRVLGEKVNPTEDCHHKRGKLGKLLMDERHWIPMCRMHHDWIRDNPNLARALGLLAQPGQWNCYEP